MKDVYAKNLHTPGEGVYAKFLHRPNAAVIAAATGAGEGCRPASWFTWQFVVAQTVSQCYGWVDTATIRWKRFFTVRTPATQLDDRDSSGKFIRGNRTGARCKGTPKNTKVTLMRTMREEAQRRIDSLLPRLIGQLEAAADEGDLQAIQMLLNRSLAGATTRTVIEGAEDIAALAPEARIRAINARVAAGTLPLEHAKQLTDLARSEMDAELLAPLRQLLVDLRRGMEPQQAIARLAGLGDLVLTSFNPDQAAQESTTYNLDSGDNCPDNGK